MARVLKIVAGITAVLSLAFGIRQAVVYIIDYRHDQRRVAELLATAEIHRGASDYRAAWVTLTEAAALNARGDAVRKAREDLAMLWLQNARAPQGTTLGAIGDTVIPVLAHGVVEARSGTRKADLLAHLGWADFLRWRDGLFQLDPTVRYREALAVDPANVFAHAMLGHWLLWGHSGHLVEANRHFAAALASGRERRFVRQFQLFALDNAPDSTADTEQLRVADEMRATNDSIEPIQRDRLWNAYESALVYGHDYPLLDPVTGVAPARLLATYEWLFATSQRRTDHPMIYAYQLGRLQEAAGDSVRALESYRLAKAAAGGSRTSFPLDEAIARLSAPRR